MKIKFMDSGVGVIFAYDENNELLGIIKINVREPDEHGDFYYYADFVYPNHRVEMELQIPMAFNLSRIKKSAKRLVREWMKVNAKQL